MYLRGLRRYTQTIGFRLTGWYLAIFVVSSLVLFSLAYLFLSSSLVRQDREAIQLKLGELSALYDAGGIRAIAAESAAEKRLGKRDLFFVRIAGSRNESLFAGMPDRGMRFALRQLDGAAPEDGKWIRLSAEHDGAVLELGSARLVDGRWLQVGKSTQDRQWILGHFRRVFAEALIPLVVLGFVGGAFLAFRAMRPIRALIQTVRSIDVGNMDARVQSPQTGDELDQLIKLFNEMLAKIENLISGMKGSLDHVAHDLRTPVTRLRGIAEMALQSGQGVEVLQEALADCVEESERITTTLNALMDISEAETGAMKLDRKAVDIPALLGRVVDLYSYVAEEKGIAIHVRAPGGLSVTADPTRMGQVLANLVDNAIKYTPSEGQVYLQADRRDGEIVISINDTGVGIPHNELPKIWDRLYRCDQSRSQKGLGLGLSLVKAIVEAHKGRVEASSEPGKGSTLSIYLPAENQGSVTP